MTMPDPVGDTIRWYDRRAAQFTAQTAELDMSALYERFLKHIQPGGRILDAGCGTGRDAAAFAQRGFAVTAIDGSSEMARIAKQTTGRGVVVKEMRFEDVEWRDDFDGIWACAS